MRQLDVYYNDTKAGILTELNPGNGYIFQYEPAYQSSDNPPISLNFPKPKGVFESEKLFPFFSNMLPEGANRSAICRMLRIDKNDYFGILTAMADKDYIGAVNIRSSSHD